MQSAEAEAEDTQPEGLVRKGSVFPRLGRKQVGVQDASLTRVAPLGPARLGQMPEEKPVTAVSWNGLSLLSCKSVMTL